MQVINSLDNSFDSNDMLFIFIVKIHQSYWVLLAFAIQFSLIYFLISIVRLHLPDLPST